ncbi:Mgm101p-domain-containing protein [Macroventuria anomochaeta]|uniref:Mgm101p-domain-containing protein n=1 Tax=Macroventuria anomochaeta TaxID=301207 RepID=A0ACB6SJI2_9PLEO|nr:Mgm101p-domain-containing protein [Macroventuria anomochaeta]KAF2633599.1 Mgm101p-domain-containing protein [Macroventuria anomochaeta]
MMAATAARRGAIRLLTSSSRPSSRSFSSSRISAAFASTPKAQATSTTTTTTAAAKPATTSASAYKSAAPAAQRTVTPSFPAKEPPVPTTRNTTAAAATTGQRSLTDGLSDAPSEIEGVAAHDWTRSYHGLGSVSFSKEQADTLLAPVDGNDVEVKPDGILYLPEIKYRRILNKAFGPGGWGLAPRGESIVTGKLVTREYGMVVQGRLVSIARGEQQYFEPDGIPTATEGCKSNALMRCCKDLGIASELWDPRFIREFNNKYTKEVWVEHQATKKKRKIVIRKDDTVKYPFRESKMGA